MCWVLTISLDPFPTGRGVYTAFSLLGTVASLELFVLSPLQLYTTMPSKVPLCPLFLPPGRAPSVPLCRGGPEAQRSGQLARDLTMNGWWSLDFETGSLMSRVIFYNAAEKQFQLPEWVVPPFSQAPLPSPLPEGMEHGHYPGVPLPKADTLRNLWSSKQPWALPASRQPGHCA